jgi:hypothetical protein
MSLHERSGTTTSTKKPVSLIKTRWYILPTRTVPGVDIENGGADLPSTDAREIRRAQYQYIERTGGLYVFYVDADSNGDLRLLFLPEIEVIEATLDNHQE